MNKIPENEPCRVLLFAPQEGCREQTISELAVAGYQLKKITELPRMLLILDNQEAHIVIIDSCGDVDSALALYATIKNYMDIPLIWISEEEESISLESPNSSDSCIFFSTTFTSTELEQALLDLLQESSQHKVKINFIPDSRIVMVDDGEVILTATEFNTLEYLYAHVNEVVD